MLGGHAVNEVAHVCMFGTQEPSKYHHLKGTGGMFKTKWVLCVAGLAH